MVPVPGVMFSTALRCLLIFAVLLTSNSQALMAMQSYLENSHTNVTADMPACHQMAGHDMSAADAPLTLECERDCHCCGGSCSAYAMTLDLPQASVARQSWLVFPLASAQPDPGSYPLQRPPIFA